MTSVNPLGLAQLGDAFTGGIAGEVVGAVRRSTSNSEWARSLRSRFGSSDANEQMKDVVWAALSYAAAHTGASASLLRTFIQHGDNRQALVSLIVDPAAPAHFSAAISVGAQERAQLRLLQDAIPASIEQAFQNALSPEGARLIASFDEARTQLDQIAQSTKATEEHTAQLLDEEMMERVITRAMERGFASLDSLVARFDAGSHAHQASLGAQAGSHSHTEILARADSALSEGRYLDAQQHVERVLNDFAGRQPCGDGETQVVRRAHALMGTLLLRSVDQAQAIPHLEALLSLGGDSARSRLINQSSLFLLSEDYEKTLGLADEALLEDSQNSDALRIKANALALLGRAREATCLLPAQDNTSVSLEDASLRAWLLREAGDFAEAREAAELVLVQFKREYLSAGVAQAALIFAETLLLEYSPFYEYGVKQRSAKAEELFRSALSYLDAVLMAGTEQQAAARTELLLCRSSLREWLGLPGVLSDIEEAVELSPANERAARNLAVTLHRAGRQSQALEFAQRYLDLSGSDDARRLLASITMQCGHHAHVMAAELLAPLAARASESPDAAEAALMLAEVYIALYRLRDAEALIGAVAETGHVPVATLLVRARYAAHLDGSRCDYLKAAVALPCPSGTEPLERREQGRWREAHVLLGRELLRQERWERVLTLLAPYVTAAVPDQNLFHYAVALLNTGDYATLLPLCEEALSALQPSEPLAAPLGALAARAYMGLEDFVSACIHFERVLPGRHERTSDLVAWGSSLLRVGAHNRALDVLRVAKQSVGESAEGLAVVGNGYAEAGDVREALILAYQAFDLAPEDERFHRNYVGLFLSREGRLLSNQTRLDEKYYSRFHDIIEHYEERFPDAPLFIRRETMPSEPEAMVVHLEALVRPRYETMQNLAQHHLRGGALPLNTIARVTGHNLLDVWELVTSNPEWGRAAFAGSQKGRVRASEVAEQATRIVADPSALITLHRLGHLREALASFDEVLVPQAFVDHLRNAQAQYFVSDDGAQRYVGLGEDGTGLTITDVPAEAAEHQRQCLNDLCAVLTDHALDPERRLCRLTGQPARPAGPIAGEASEAFFDVLGSAGWAAVYAEANGLPLLTDSRLLSTYAQASGMQVTDSYSVLARLNAQGDITWAEHEDALLQLIAWGYSHVAVSASTLYRTVLRKGGFTVSRSTQVFDYIAEQSRGTATGLETASYVLRQFTLMLWMTPAFGVLPAKHARQRWGALVFKTLACLVSPDWAFREFQDSFNAYESLCAWTHRVPNPDDWNAVLRMCR